MAMSRKAAMTIQSYQNQAKVYNLSQLISTFYFKTYAGLNKIQRMEWDNRAMSTLHAVFIAFMSMYFVFWSDLFSDQVLAGFVTFRSSQLSNFSLGIVHHLLSGIAVAYSLLSGEGQLYTFMILISEVTTPEINIRWYLDVSGLKRSSAYLINGILVFFAWLVARILLFIYMFYHVYLHYDQVKQMHTFGFLLVFVVPSVLATMNLIWFGKILKGLKKTLAKRL